MRMMFPRCRKTAINASVMAAGAALLIISCSGENASSTKNVNEANASQESAPSADKDVPAPEFEPVPGAVYAPGTDHVLGYNDGPYLAGGKWRVHDPERPRPEVVAPQSGVFTPPPSDAVVLFDGADMSKWRRINDAAPDWIIEGSAMRVPTHDWSSGGADILSTEAFGDMQLHIEWRTPPNIVSGSQGRGNSGVFLMDNYEVQVLDSYQNETYADGQASALYGWKPPLVNATLPPGEWQSYDIFFEAPEFDENSGLRKPAFVTVVHNGVLVHHREALPGQSAHRDVGRYQAHADRMPIRLQDHGNPIEFRNIWVRDLDLDSND